MQGVFIYTGTFGGRKMARAFSIGYTFGFNGMEKLDEAYSDANAYDFGARIYAPRLVRWLMNRKKHMKYPFIILFWVCSFYTAFTQNCNEYLDSLRVNFIGLERGDKYRIKYLNDDVYLNCKSEKCSYYLSFKRDTTDLFFSKIKVFKKGQKGYNNTFLSVVDNKYRKFLILHKSKRLKKRYAIDYFWGDELFYNIHEGS